METIEYINPSIDRSKWPSGEWDKECDKMQWQDAATGLPCLAVRNCEYGNWCGYVGVPPTHAMYKKEYDVPDVEVHGGLTFAGKCQERVNECDGVCHVAPAGEDDVWWLGFDCHHAYDYAPGMAPIYGELRYLFFDSTEASYRTLEFVQDQCTELAKQLANYKDA